MPQGLMDKHNADSMLGGLLFLAFTLGVMVFIGICMLLWFDR